MKQWVTRQDGLDKLQLVDAPEPSALGEGEVLVRINRVSLNYRDTEVCMGLYGHHETLSKNRDHSGDDGGGHKPPLVPCSDMCGTVEKLGPGVAGGDGGGGDVSSSVALREGDRVMATFNQSHLSGQIEAADMASGLGLPLGGVLAQYRVFPASGLVRVPPGGGAAGLTDEEAATLPIAAVTAWMGINSLRPIGDPLRGGDDDDGDKKKKEKKKVVLLQGTGGVAIAGLQIAKALGLTAIVTSSSDAKLERARALGADHTINYRATPAWDDAVLALTGGRGADVILECGGAGTLRRSFACVAFGGLISCIGYLSGKGSVSAEAEEGGALLPDFNVNVLALSRNVNLKGIINGPRDRFEEMLRTVYSQPAPPPQKEKDDGAAPIRPVVDRVFEFEDAPRALQHIYAGGHFGKVVIKVP